MKASAYSRRSLSWLVLAIFSAPLIFCAIAPVCIAQDTSSYVLQTGRPSFSAIDPIPSGWVNISNGNLHVEIPLGSYAQRGGRSINLKLVYDSRIFVAETVPNNPVGFWTTTQGLNINNEKNNYLGWHLVGQAQGRTLAPVNLTCPTGTPAGTSTVSQTGPITWTDENGDNHIFLINQPGTCTASGGINPQPTDSYSIDGSGYHIFFDAGPDAVIYAKNGTLVYKDPPQPTNGMPVFATQDANGNSFTWTQDTTGTAPSIITTLDTLHRSLITVTPNVNRQLSLLNSQNSENVFTIQSAAPVGLIWTNFLVENVSDCTPQEGHCQFPSQVIQAITLPDGSQYKFTYDCDLHSAGGATVCTTGNALPSGGSNPVYGLMTSMTLPSGGTINFTYSNFSDSIVYTGYPNGIPNRWLTSVSYGGGQTTYTQATGCGTNCQTVTVARPSGANEVYTFDTNSFFRALNTKIQYFEGTVGGTPSLTIQNDFESYTVPIPPNAGFSASGAAFPHIKDSIVTVPSPAGNLVSETAYLFDHFVDSSGLTVTTGKLLSKSEFGFGLGSVGPLVRQTNLTYLDDTNSSYKSTQNGRTVNIMDRVVDQQTLDGAGNLIAETKTSYDSTSLISATGINAHDDTNFSAAFTTRGNPTQFQNLVSPSTFITSATLTYDSTGQIRTVQDGNGNTTQLTYADNYFTDGNSTQNPPPSFAPPSPTNAFPTSLARPIIGTSSLGYYYGTGQQASSIDENGADSYTHYIDTLNRPTHTLGPSVNSARPWAMTTYSAGGSQVDSYTAIGDASPSTNCVSCLHTRQTTDGFGRPIQSALLSDPDGPTTLTAVSYDSSGRTQTLLNPYRTTSDPTYGSSTLAYDSLARPTLLTEADGSTVHVYYGASVVSPGGLSAQLCSPSTYRYGYPTLRMDESGKKTQSWADAFGNTIEVDEPNSSGALTLGTCYTYGVLENLTSVTQMGGSTSTQWRVRTFVYDGLSRLTSATEPESGTTTFTYDLNGNVLTQTKPAPNQTSSATVTTTYKYDALNRATSKSYSDGVTPTVTYVYDGASTSACTLPTLTVSNGLGRRTGMCDAAGSEAWSYDPAGRTVTDARNTGNVNGIASYAYNLDGSFAAITYPNGRTITYSPGTAGRPLSAVDAANSINYATAAHYSPSGALSSLTNGAGIVSKFYYNSRLQPCRISVTSSGNTPSSCTDTTSIGNVLDYSYNYSLGTDNGNVTAIANNRSTSRSQSFTYDSLNRISTASSSWGMQFGYDPWGNLLSETVTTGTAPSLSQTVGTNNQITGFCYDSAGNLLDEGACPSGAHTFTYTPESQLSTAGAPRNTYDGDGKRVEQSGLLIARSSTASASPSPYIFRPPTTTITYWYGISDAPIEETTSGTVTSGGTEYIFFNAQRVARLDSANNVDYYFADHQGTARVVANSSGTILDDSDFYPFGGELAFSTSSGNTYKFTGYDRDSSGLDYAGARHYSSSLGRFMSPDPLSGTPVNPQSWNRYAYVLNNPLNATDPTGLCPDENGDDDGSPCSDDPPSDPQPPDPFGPIDVLGIFQQGNGGTSSQSSGFPALAGFGSNNTGYFDDGSILSQIANPSLCAGCLQRFSGAYNLVETGTIFVAGQGLSVFGGAIPILGKTLYYLNLASLAPSPRLASRGLYSLNKLNNHHELPQQRDLRARFEAAGIDINDPQYIKRIPRYLHEDIHNGLYTDGVRYNDVWEQFFEQNPTASEEEILQFLQQLRIP